MISGEIFLWTDHIDRMVLRDQIMTSRLKNS